MPLSSDSATRLGIALANVQDGVEVANILNAPFYDGANKVFTAAGNVTMAVQQKVSVINKGTGAATTVTLPATPSLWQTALVKDGKGDAGTNNITIQGAAAATIDGASTAVLSTNYGVALVMWNGTEWSRVV